MKELLFNTAKELVLNNHSNETFNNCGSELKKHFLGLGYDVETANQFAIDALKIVYKTLQELA
tara:strand:+ start:173 stop:361 length:189 start_codon:yes stop_codon:yes gene_type:complete